MRVPTFLVRFFSRAPRIEYLHIYLDERGARVWVRRPADPRWFRVSVDRTFVGAGCWSVTLNAEELGAGFVDNPHAPR